MKRPIFLLCSSLLMEGDQEISDLAVLDSLNNVGRAKTEKLLHDALLQKELEVLLINPVKIQLNMGGGKVFAYYEDELISNYEIMLVKRTKRAERQIFEIATIFEDNGMVVVDPARSLLYPSAKQLDQYMRSKKVLVPNSIFMGKAGEEVFERTQKLGLNFPYVIKPQDGTMGKDVIIANKKDDVMQYAEKHPDTPIIIQEKLNIKNEYRVMLIGGKSIGICRKISEKDVKNVAQGATLEFLSEGDPKVEEAAILATRYHGGDIYGPDVVRTKDNKLYVLEHNRNPNFAAFNKASEMKIEDRIIDFCLAKYKNIRQK